MTHTPAPLFDISAPLDSLEDCEALAAEIHALILDDKSLGDCLDLIAGAYGYDSHSQMKAALVGDGAIPQERRDEILRFWQSPALSDFITDYACRRRPVVLALSRDGSIIAAESSPNTNTVFEIAATHSGFTVFDLGVGPYSPHCPSHFRIPMDTYAAVSQAFAALAKSQNWEW